MSPSAHDWLLVSILTIQHCRQAVHQRRKTLAGSGRLHNTQAQYSLLFHVPTLVSAIGHFQLLDTAVEQPSVQPTTVWPYPSAVPLGVKDVFVWLTDIPVRSDFLFVVCYTNFLIYLLTYLPITTGKVTARLYETVLTKNI